MGRGRGRSVYKQPGTGVDGNRTTHKGGIPSKLRGIWEQGRDFQAKGDHQGGSSRGIKGIVPCASNIMSTMYISC
jgi:hypothetical protein